MLELAASLLQQLRCRGANADAAGCGLTLTANGGQLGLRGRADAGAGLGDGGELLEEGIERFAAVTREQVDLGAIAEPLSPQRQLVAMQLEGLEAEVITAEGQNPIDGLGQQQHQAVVGLMGCAAAEGVADLLQAAAVLLEQQ